jgi:hypothetical protein
VIWMDGFVRGGELLDGKAKREGRVEFGGRCAFLGIENECRI